MRLGNNRYTSPLRYPGGKSKAIRQIAPLLPQRVREYREPMVGGGSVFFAARGMEIARRYWINDAFPDLFSFWKAVQSQDTCERLRSDLEELRQSFDDPTETKAFFHRAREEQPEDDYRR
ncbi:MAG: DNA adenine methylase, partial [Armatimonadetes bacterium]|nr:DNA adenine methylase [Armatimonadota bacterium]